MRLEKKKTAETTDPIGPGAGIDAENYAERAAAFIAAQPEKRGFIIRAFEGSRGAKLAGKSATDAQWIAWMKYFSQKKISASFAVQLGEATVPAEWPELFDVEAATSDPYALLEHTPAPRFSFGQRALQLSDGLAAKLQAIGKPQRPKPPKASVQLHGSEEIDFGRPLTVGDELRESLSKMAPMRMEDDIQF